MSELSPRGILSMAGRNWRVYRKTWYVNALPPLMEPLLYLVALGYGLGALIESVDFAGTAIRYVVFLAPAIICITTMQTAFMETTYASYVRMVFQKTYDALLATPLSAYDVLVGEVVWAALRAAINASLMMIVVAAFGLLAWPSALLIPLIAFLIGLMFAGLGLMVSSKVKVIDQFSYAFFLFITPMFLFSGTFFPLSQLPGGVKVLAYMLPLTHAVALVRSAALGVWTGAEPWHLLYLVSGAVVFPALAVRMMRRRLVQ